MRYSPKLQALSDLDMPRGVGFYDWNKDVVFSYLESIRGLSRLASMIPSIVKKSIVFEHILAESVFVSETVDVSAAKKVSTEEARQLLDTKRRHIEDNVTIMGMTTDQRAIFYAESFFGSDESSGDYQIYLGMIITTMWTVFEVLATDLWIAALNDHPKTLSSLSGQRLRIQTLAGYKDSDGDDSRTQFNKNYDKSVDLSLIQKYSYDLSKSMGHLLKNKQRFSSLDGIREAYSLAFSKNSAKIDDVLSNHALDKIASLRNLLLHNGGICDKAYLSKCQRLGLTSKAEIGLKVQLDGELIVDIIKPVSELCLDLIEEVGVWVTGHPRQPRYA